MATSTTVTVTELLVDGGYYIFLPLKRGDMQTSPVNATFHLISGRPQMWKIWKDKELQLGMGYS